MKLLVLFLLLLAYQVSSDELTTIEPLIDSSTTEDSPTPSTENTEEEVFTTSPMPTTEVTDCTLWCEEKPGCKLIYDWCWVGGCFYYDCETTTEEETTEAETTEECPATCPDPPSSFSYYMRLTPCSCDLVWCSPPLCEGSGVDWARCSSCDHCPCLPITTTESETISPPFCPDGEIPDWENCSVDNCPCIPDATTGTETVTETTECPATCPESPSSFCYYMRTEPCRCDLVCCAPPRCEGSGVDWANCWSCDHCPCLPLTSPEPETISPPNCPDGEIPDWENCSVDNCPCIPDYTTTTGTETTVEECTPCPLIPSSFCSYVQPETCACEMTCCWPPKCDEGFEVDWANCWSCDHCPCLSLTNTTETTSEEPTTTTTELYCGSTCEFKEGCITSRNMQTCECSYDCPTTSAPTTKKLKCFAI